MRNELFIAGRLVGMLAAVVAGSGTARAQPDAGVPNAAAPDAAVQRRVDGGRSPIRRGQLHPPRLVETVKADYPAQAKEAGIEGEVVLRLTIGVDGKVTQAEVMEPAGHGFDEAARQAALDFRFEPARRGDTPMPSRILYTYAFQVPEPTAANGMKDDRSSGNDAAARQPKPRASPSPSGPDPAQPPEQAAIEVTVRGQSEGERLRRSAQAVHVVETEQAQRRTADMGEVLARTQGVGVRRSGGLGSNVRFSLNGLNDDKIRFFLDGVPLDLAGYPFGIANVPVNLIERVDLYRGVVPIRFGADALGGAVNLISKDVQPGTHLNGSLMAGSFDTQRYTLEATHMHDASGVFVRIGGFFDDTDNDYVVDVEVHDEKGKLSPARVRRFHDAYRASGGHVEIGVLERPWADRLVLRGFVTEMFKEIQHNVSMEVPYGEAEWDQISGGETLEYAKRFGDAFRLEAMAGFASNRIRFQDVTACIFDWFGRCTGTRRAAGEIERMPRDQVRWEWSGFGRFHFAWTMHPQHELRLSLSPTYVDRTGDERRQVDPDARDPLSAERRLTTLVSGIEYEVDLFGDRLENVLFFKDYLQFQRSEERLPGDVYRRKDRDTHRFGVGNALRFRFSDALYAKASYEWATRLPRPDEVFGRAPFVRENLDLAPERSHNVNLGLTLDANNTDIGGVRANVNLFLRETDKLIIRLGHDQQLEFQNVFGARAIGVEASAGWTSPRDYLVVDGNVTWQDFRNASEEGAFGRHQGDRIPNRPYLFANTHVRLQLPDVAASGDELALAWNGRYVHDFFRSWESPGLRESKDVIPAQLVHSIALIYRVQGDPAALSFTGEVQNLTDAKVFDFFGAQRPGRAFYFKTTAEL